MSEGLPVRARVSGRAFPLREDDIDTDRIIPARFMKCVTFDGLGEYAFRDARFDAAGRPTGHPFDDPRRKGAAIVASLRNFGCGSSREHAPQALAKAGVRGIVAESFAEIFAGNCAALGIPALALARADAEELLSLSEADPALEVELDLERMEVRAGGKAWRATMKEGYRKALLAGTWDSVAELLANAAGIRAAAARVPYFSFRPANP